MRLMPPHGKCEQEALKVKVDVSFSLRNLPAFSAVWREGGVTELRNICPLCW